MRLTVQDAYTVDSKVEARPLFEEIISWLRESTLEPMIKSANMLQDHIENILNYFDSKLTNAILEGTNSIIQYIKARARGFKNVEYFKTMIYLLAGNFEVTVFK